jgi:hypothetical protein
VLTKDILFGMNILTLAGFLVMGLSLTLHRTGRVGAPLSIGLMSRGDGSGVVRAVRRRLVELAETVPPTETHLAQYGAGNTGEIREIGIRTAVTHTGAGPRGARSE